MLGGLGMALCVRALVDERSRVADALAAASVVWLIAAVGCAAAAMVLIALGWGRCIRALGAPTPPSGALLRWYFAGELGKYVPGSVWPIIGRGELLRRGGASGQVAYASVVLSLAMLYGASILPIGVLLLHPAVLTKVRSVVERLARRRLELPVVPFGRVVQILLGYVPVWVLIAATTMAVARALHAGGSVWRLAAATVLSWLVGFLAVPVPAGAGVREAAFVGLSGLPAGLGATVAITSRLCFIVVDGVGGALSLAAVARERRAIARRADVAR